LRGERIHRIEELELYALDQNLLTSLQSHLTRRMAFSLTVSERHLYLTVGEENLTAVIERVQLPS
jgi:uncharacterized protein YaeQ